MAETAVEIYNVIAASLTADAAPFAMHQADVNGRKHRVYANAKRNLTAIFAEIMTAFPDRILVHEEDRQTSYAEVFENARRLAGALQHEFGVQPGQPVALAMANRMEWLAAFIALSWTGAIAVLLNSRGTAAELEAALEDIGTDLVIADGRRAKLILENNAAARIIVVDDGTELPASVTAFSDLLMHAPAEAVDLASDEPAAILFTSGTTGRPKGAVLTHRNLTNMVENLKFLSTTGVTAAARAYGIEVEVLRQMMPPISTLLVFPMFHISGITAFFSTAQAGGMLTMLRRWQPANALTVIAANKVTLLSGPPLVVADLLDQENAAEQLASVNNVAVGGQATPASLIARVQRALPMAALSGGWGSTEVSGSVVSASGAIYAYRPHACGLASPLMEMRVVDDAGVDLPPGESGEIWLRGALVMAGYWNKPDATAEAFSGDWLKSGDVGYLDAEGFLHLNDRKKDMVISGGENVYCAEVERVLSADEAFAEVALFGVPDARLGERAVAAVTLRNGYSRSEDEVKAYVRAALAEYKVPTAVEFELGVLPRTATGKINKTKLRSLYLERLKETV